MRHLRSCLTPVLVLAVSLPVFAADSGRPTSVPLSEVEISIVSIAVGLLDQGCEFGSHRASFVIEGTGQARFEFEILGREECPAEVREFELSRRRVEDLLDRLWSAYFFDLAAEYSGRPGVHLDYETDPPGTLADMIAVTDHDLDVTVEVKLGEFAHSVHFEHGAEVPGLTPHIRDLLPKLWRKSGFRRHLPPEQRGEPEPRQGLRRTYHQITRSGTGTQWW